MAGEYRPVACAVASRQSAHNVLPADVRAPFSGHVPKRFELHVGPRQEIVDLEVGKAVGDPGEPIGEIGVAGETVELAGPDGGGDDGSVFPAAVSLRHDLEDTHERRSGPDGDTPIMSLIR